MVATLNYFQFFAPNLFYCVFASVITRLECQGKFLFPNPSGHNLPPDHETTEPLTVVIIVFIVNC